MPRGRSGYIRHVAPGTERSRAFRLSPNGEALRRARGRSRRSGRSSPRHPSPNLQADRWSTTYGADYVSPSKELDPFTPRRQLHRSPPIEHVLNEPEPINRSLMTHSTPSPQVRSPQLAPAAAWQDVEVMARSPEALVEEVLRLRSELAAVQAQVAQLAGRAVAGASAHSGALADEAAGAPLPESELVSTSFTIPLSDNEASDDLVAQVVRSRSPSGPRPRPRSRPRPRRRVKPAASPQTSRPRPARKSEIGGPERRARPQPAVVNSHTKHASSSRGRRRNRTRSRARGSSRGPARRAGPRLEVVVRDCRPRTDVTEQRRTTYPNDSLARAAAGWRPGRGDAGTVTIHSNLAHDQVRGSPALGGRQ